MNNLKFDFILALLSNVGGIQEWDRWATLMVILTVVGKLARCNVKLSPSMGVIITFLYENGYQSKLERCITEEELWKEIQKKYAVEDNFFSGKEQFYACIGELIKLKVIRLEEGRVCLLEELKISL